ncbi:MAG TPA: hypothetical protein GXX29_12685 [Firmicutes bacterium]|nr:hypothetical protein [Bacillota bacterium]
MFPLIMTSAQAEEVHNVSLRILEEIGVRLEHDAIVERMVAAGARLGREAQVVHFPAGMVRDYLAAAPQEVILHGRNGDTFRLTADSEAIYWTNPAMYIWDGRTRCRITTHHLAAIARLCTFLPNVHGVIGTALADTNPACSDFVGLRVMAQNTGKHLRVLCSSPLGAEAISEMKTVFPGNWFSMGFTAHGPLRWTHLALDIFRKTAGKRIPATINGEPMAGVTGPVSLAGTIAVGNAEILAGIVVNQVLEPGRPVIYNLGLAHVMDMKAATAVTGGPENCLLAAASAAMGRFYRLPSSSWASTDAVFEDEQAALEKMFALYTHVENQVNLIWGLGQLESELTISLSQLLIDNEMIEYIRHYRRGIPFGAEDLALDTIRQVGIGGNFLDTEHTYRNYRTHLFQPSLLNRQRRENCPQDLAERARELAASLLSGTKEGEKEQKKVGEEISWQELVNIENRYLAKLK